jgi:hypothetical protein
MTRQTLQHLTPDEIDLVLEGSYPEGVRGHLNTCPDCDKLILEERGVVRAIAALPLHVPSADFEDRVMALVNIVQPASVFATIRRRAFASRRSLAVAATLAIGLLASLAGSVAWSLGNMDLLAATGSSVLGVVAESGWVVARALTSNLIEQPWYSGARDLLDSPLRLAFAAGGLVATWAAGLLLLRRLMAIPAQRVAHESF